MVELLEELQSGTVFTPNVDHIIRLQKDPEFQQAYSMADYRICDGQILLYASWFLGTPIRERIAGSDFFPAFCQFHQHNPDIKIFLLGAEDGVAQAAQARINQKIGRSIVVGTYSPPFGFEQDPAESHKIVQMIQDSGATVLAIGVGAPKQEKWLYRHKDRLPSIKIFMAIGATIDFEAGHKARSPRWMGDMGLEWLYRLMTEPKRLWRRYLVDDLPFFWLILKQKLMS